MKMIKGFLEKTNFRLFLLRFANILNEIIRVFVILAQSKLKLKRGKLRRSQIKAVFASANWAMFYECNVTEAKNIVKEIFGLKINITRTVFSTLL